MAEFPKEEATILTFSQGGMVAALACLTPQSALALILGYGQTLIATDTVRLYTWAAPALAIAITQGLPSWTLAPIAAATLLNPWKGNGV